MNRWGWCSTVTTTPGTQSFSSKPSNRGRRKQDRNAHTVRLRLLPNGAQERRLRRIADATAKLWNELNYARLMRFRASGAVFNHTDTAILIKGSSDTILDSYLIKYLIFNITSTSEQCSFLLIKLWIIWNQKFFINMLICLYITSNMIN